MYPNQLERWTCWQAARLKVDGATAQPQPLTVEQERHHVEKVDGEKATVSAREVIAGPKERILLEQRLSMPKKAVNDTGERVKVGQVGEAESSSAKRLSQCPHL